MGATIPVIKRSPALPRILSTPAPGSRLPEPTVKNSWWLRLPREASIATMARQAAACGEVPVGCVIVKDGAVVGRGRNRREERQAAWSHAEMEAMAQANRALGTWRLDGCTLYVTLEPCPMCAGAILNARVSRVYFGARDREMGACGGVMNLFMEDFPHPPALVGGVLEEECARVLREFFRGLREK